MLPPLPERETCPCDKIPSRTRDEDLPRRSFCSNTGGDADGDSGRFPVVQLALANVDPDPHVETQSLHPGDDFLTSAHSTCRPVKGGKEPVACSVAFLSTEPRQLPTHERVMLVEQIPPCAIAE